MSLYQAANDKYNPRINAKYDSELRTNYPTLLRDKPTREISNRTIAEESKFKSQLYYSLRDMGLDTDKLMQIISPTLLSSSGGGGGGVIVPESGVIMKEITKELLKPIYIIGGVRDIKFFDFFIKFMYALFTLNDDENMNVEDKENKKKQFNDFTEGFIIMINGLSDEEYRQLLKTLFEKKNNVIELSNLLKIFNDLKYKQEMLDKQRKKEPESFKVINEFYNATEKILILNSTMLPKIMKILNFLKSLLPADLLKKLKKKGKEEEEEEEKEKTEEEEAKELADLIKKNKKDLEKLREVRITLQKQEEEEKEEQKKKTQTPEQPYVTYANIPPPTTTTTTTKTTSSSIQKIETKIWVVYDDPDVNYSGVIDDLSVYLKDYKLKFSYYNKDTFDKTAFKGDSNSKVCPNVLYFIGGASHHYDENMDKERHKKFKDSIAISTNNTGELNICLLRYAAGANVVKPLIPTPGSKYDAYGQIIYSNNKLTVGDNNNITIINKLKNLCNPSQQQFQQQQQQQQQQPSPQQQYGTDKMSVVNQILTFKELPKENNVNQISIPQTSFQQLGGLMLDINYDNDIIKRFDKLFNLVKTIPNNTSLLVIKKLKEHVYDIYKKYINHVNNRILSAKTTVENYNKRKKDLDNIQKNINNQVLQDDMQNIETKFDEIINGMNDDQTDLIDKKQDLDDMFRELEAEYK